MYASGVTETECCDPKACFPLYVCGCESLETRGRARSDALFVADGCLTNRNKCSGSAIPCAQGNWKALGTVVQICSWWLLRAAGFLLVETVPLEEKQTCHSCCEIACLIHSKLSLVSESYAVSRRPILLRVIVKRMNPSKQWHQLIQDISQFCILLVCCDVFRESWLWAGAGSVLGGYARALGRGVSCQGTGAGSSSEKGEECFCLFTPSFLREGS